MDVQSMPNVSVPIAVTHQDDILERIAAGERIADIALEYGRTGPALTMALAKHLPAEYDAALKSQAESRMLKYEIELENAPDGLSVSRARELLAQSRWKLERLNPQRWGQVRQAVQVNTDGPATINIVSWADDQTPT